MQLYQQIEWALLSPEGVSALAGLDESASFQFAKDFLAGDFAPIITSPFAREILASSGPLQFDDAVADLSARLAAHCAGTDHTPDSALSLLILGAALLQAFVQANWLGPALEAPVAPAFALLSPGFDPADAITWQRAAVAWVSQDEADAYPLLREPALLIAAVLLFEHAAPLFAAHELTTALLWSARVTFAHQRMLDDRCMNLREAVYARHREFFLSLPAGPGGLALPSLLGKPHPATDPDCPPGSPVSLIYARFYLEHACALHYFHDLTCHAALVAAQAATGLEWELTGALGRKTKFQLDARTMLVVFARYSDTAKAQYFGQKPSQPAAETDIPKALDLNDDQLLDRMRLDDSAAAEVGQLTSEAIFPLDQAILLGFSNYFKLKDPSSDLTSTELTAFVEYLIESPKNWLVHSSTLLLRSRLEASKTRRLERATLQIQALVDQFADAEPGVASRGSLFYQLDYPNLWRMQSDLATLFTKLGLLKSALDLFEKLENWEGLITCLARTGQSSRAEAVVREQLAQHPTPKMYCILGDILGSRDTQPYEQALALARGGHYARAHRALGLIHFKNDEVERALPHLEHASRLNPLGEHNWWTLSGAYAKLENWPKAAGALTRVVSLAPDDAEAWSNLSIYYTKMGRLVESHRSLKEATRLNRDSWRMWENLVLVSLVVNEYSDVILGMSRLLEIRKDNPIDEQNFGRLIHAYMTGKSDASETPLHRYTGQLESLVDRIVEACPGNANVLAICAQFFDFRFKSNLPSSHYVQRVHPEHYEPLPEVTQTMCLDDKAVDLYLRAYRASNLRSGWENDAASLKAVSEHTTAAVEALLARASRHRASGAPDAEGLAKTDLYQARTIIRGFLSRAKRTFPSSPEVQAMEELQAKATA